MSNIALAGIPVNIEFNVFFINESFNRCFYSSVTYINISFFKLVQH
jgi:hypothetical protein